MTRKRGTETEYLIIGNSAGAIGAAEAIREADAAGTLTMVSDEPYPAYSRPLIAKYLAGERGFDRMLYRPADFYERNAIRLLPGKRATGLDLDDHVVTLEGGERIRWKRLLIASGGRPIVPQVSGMDKRGVFNFITFDDARAIDGFLGNATSAVVIGGGLIGISASEALARRGIAVTIVEMKEGILNTILDAEASAMAAAAVESAGVRIIVGHTVAEVKGRELVTSVVLDNGETIACSLVVVAIGVLPRIDLAQGSGIAVNRGIVVDRRMATSHPDVFACGDAAESYDFVIGGNRLTPVWPNAHIGGRIAGFNMAGVEKEYGGGTAMNSLTYFGTSIVSAGSVTGTGDEGCEVLVRRGNGTYKKVILRDDVMVGLICIGDIEKSGMLYGLMRDRVNVRDFKGKLLDDDFGLVHLPRELWQRKLGMSPSADAASPGVSPEEGVTARAGE